MKRSQISNAKRHLNRFLFVFYNQRMEYNYMLKRDILILHSATFGVIFHEILLNHFKYIYSKKQSGGDSGVVSSSFRPTSNLLSGSRQMFLLHHTARSFGRRCSLDYSSSTIKPVVFGRNCSLNYSFSSIQPVVLE